MGNRERGNGMIDLFQRIASEKRAEVDELKRKLTPDDLASGLEAGPRYGFRTAVEAEKGAAIIAELPWRVNAGGSGGGTLDPITLAAQYRTGGAAAIAVLTDQKFFGGRPENMEIAKRASQLPVLGKDFVIDPYQVRLARFMNADAVQLVVRLLTRKGLADCLAACTELQMDGVAEILHEGELEIALEAGARVVCVNLRTDDGREPSVERMTALVGSMPSGVLAIAGGGIADCDQVSLLRKAGFKGVLVGEALQKAADPTGFLQSLRQA
jgi:indole-3-glycerol phosphate synthase